MKKILVTGAAGFIGFHLSRRLCADGCEVLGLDNLNSYYDVTLKQDRLAQLAGFDAFRFEEAALEDAGAIARLVADFRPDAVVNLAAQAGVRYSLENPQAYVGSNLAGFVNILEACRHNDVKHLVFASSSSVYGANTKLPWAVEDTVDHPISLYAATKKANELMAHSYAHLFGIPCTGLRFFTVYGPWGRPDMAVFKFTKAIFEGQTIPVFNHGQMRRDFTYIDDIIEGVARIIQIPAAPNVDWDSSAPDPASSNAPYRLYNIGNNSPVELMEMIRMLEKEVGIEAKIDFQPMQAGDVMATFADVQALEDAVGFKPSTPLDKGLRQFVQWYREYYRLGNGPAG